MKLLTTSFRKIMLAGLLLAALAASAGAQDARIQMSQLDRFNDMADKIISIDVGESLINLAKSALNPKRSVNEAKIIDILTGLKGVYVKRFEFDKDGAYTAADVDYIRSQFNGPGWEHIANVRSKREGNYDVVMMYEGSIIKGLGVLAAEPRALTVVNVIGAIDLAKLRDLEGNFGIPKFGLEQMPGVTVQDNHKDKPRDEQKKPQDEPKKPQ
ncbi:MAG TPA: DUF4252 domain-containing protein [Blastocatellia bacterium]|nr:DUF4252 domain-containing protein [Blastocatellia bacterium]